MGTLEKKSRNAWGHYPGCVKLLSTIQNKLFGSTT